MDASAAVMNYPRRDARDKLTGRTRYTVDRAAPGMLHAAVLRSEVASARIVALDVSAAEAMPGVRAVITAKDAPGLHGIGVADHPLFASDRIRYHAEPLAAVAADTPGDRRGRPARDPGGDGAASGRHHHGGGVASGRAAGASRLEDLRDPVRGREPRRQRRLGGDGGPRRRRRRLRAGRRDVVESQFRIGRPEPPVLRAARRDRDLRGRALSTSRARRRFPGRCAMSPRACCRSRLPRCASPCRRSGAGSGSSSIAPSSLSRRCWRGNPAARSSSSIRGRRRC